MEQPTIRVEGLGKRYRIGVRQPKEGGTWETLLGAVSSPLSYLRETLRAATEQETLWAIRNLTFHVNDGEVLGIIGPNGAGKSTLLKILSRITDPTEGRAVLHGRVGSLLEVGTGFHPDLTGRENIYLKGSMLGMKRLEIDRKLEEIVEFSEIGRFLDTPVKRYSSGMGVRLGFAVAAHLDPEILIVDEVLAVGDLAFQRKCMGKISQIARDGRTVLFVSHSMPTVQALCHRVLLLEAGRISYEGSPTAVVNRYENEQNVPGMGQIDLAEHPHRITAQRFFQSLVLRNEEGTPTSRFRLGEKITFELTLALGDREMSDPFIALGIERHGQAICHLVTHFMHKDQVHVRGNVTARCQADLGLLAPGSYTINRVSFKKRSGGERLDQIESVGSFEIYPVDVYGTGKVNFLDGIVVPKGTWEIKSSVPDVNMLALAVPI